MTWPRIASICCALLGVFLPFGAQSLSPCEIPADVLTGRSLSETRKIVEGEVVFVADAQLHDFEGRTTSIVGLVKARAIHDAVG